MTLIGATAGHKVLRPGRVSILVFLDDAHRQLGSDCTVELDQGFQSLFSWMTLIGVMLSVLGMPVDGVSILVFLDDAHRRLGLFQVRDSGSRCFNPCFLG